MKRIGMNRGNGVLCGLLLVLLLPCLAGAQSFPTKPITLLVGFAPGGNFDISARVLSGKAQKFLGQPIMVSNNGAGGGSVALGNVAKQKPDGYHLAGCTSTGLVRLPQLRNVPYKLDDFVPIMHFTGGSRPGLVVKSDSPWKTLKEFIDYAKKNPGSIMYSTTGVGSGDHLAMEVIAKKEGIKWTHIPYPGSAPAITALLGGHVMAESGDSSWLPHVQDGSLRLLATYGETRLESFPAVPTLQELGYDYLSDVVYVIAAPKGTPQPIVKQLDDAFHKGMADPEFIQTLNRMSIRVAYRGPEDTKKYLQEAHLRMGRMISDFADIFSKIKEEEGKK